MKINLIGTYPPPYGGISIHIKRLREKFKKNNDVKIIALNKVFEEGIESCSLKKLLVKLIFINSKEIIHSNLTGRNGKLFLGYYCFLFNKKIIITVHGAGLTESYQNSNFLIKKIYKFSLKNLTHIIVVNRDIKEECLSLGITEEKISVISPYLNPVINEEDYKKIDKSVWDFIEKNRKNGSKIITGNGNIRFFNNEDLYGLDMLIELIYLLKQRNYKVSLVFALLGYKDQTNEERRYFEDLENRIKRYKIEEDIFIYKVKDTEYYPILEKSDIFIRPTNTDGDAISIREAIYLKKPNISSDIVKRPEESMLFKTRNINDLVNKTEYIIKNYQNEVKKLKKIKVKEYYEEVLEVYKKVYEGI